MFLCKYDLLIAAILLSSSSYPIPPHPYVAFELMLGYQDVSSLDNCFHPSELEEEEHRKRVTNKVFKIATLSPTNSHMCKPLDSLASISTRYIYHLVIQMRKYVPRF